MALIAGHYEKVRALAATSRLFVVGGARASDRSRLTVYDYTTNKTVHEIDVPAHVLGLVLAGEEIAAACADGFVRVYANGAEARKFLAHRGAVNGIALVPARSSSELGRDRIATVGSDGALRVWTLANGAKSDDHALSASALRAVAADVAGEYLAAAGDDGVVRTVHLPTKQIRAMSGHQGPVRALAFTPRDGRVASAGDDGTIRLWYLVGDVEFEIRGGDADTGHAGGVLALLFPPTPPNPADGTEPIDRFYSAGSDGKVKAWRLESRVRPKTLDCGDKPVHALAFVPLASAQPASMGSILAAGDARSLRRFTLDITGNPADTSLQYGNGFDAQQTALTTGQRPARETSVRTLAALEERESLDLLLKQLGADKEPEVRALIARELGERGRRAARPKLRESLDDAHPTVRAAAFDALLLLDRDAPLAPLRHALASKYPEVRIRALGHLVPLRESSPLVPGLIADKLVDPEPTVRVTALEQLSALHPANSPEPLRLAYERGPADLKIEVLVRAAYAGLLGNGAIAPLVARALDDADPGVRRSAYTLEVLDKRALAATLEPRDEDLARSILEVLRRGAQLRRKKAAPPPSQPTVAATPGLAGTSWKGKAHGFDFTLVIEKAADGVIEGYQDWSSGHRAAIKGTWKGNQIEFTDTKVLRGDAESFNLGDPKKATITADGRMTGTDAGQPFSAVRWSSGPAATPKPAVTAVPEATSEELKAARESLPGSGTAGAPPGEADLEPVLTAMACRTPDTALRGARGLAALGDMRALGALLQLSRESDANLRREAANALSMLQDPRAKKRLVWMLDDGDAAVRAAALDSFSKLEPSAPLKPAEAALRSAHEDIRVRGLDRLVKVGSEPTKPAEAETLLGDALEDESQKVRGEAFRTLWAWHQQDPVGALDRALKGRFPDLRLRAISELEARGKESWAYDRLKASISDRDAGVAAAAYNAAIKIKGKADPEPHVLAMGSSHVAVRALAAAAAVDAPVDAVRPALTKLLQDEKPEPRLAALETLAKNVSENGPLLAALQSGFHDLKVRAAEHLAVRHDEQLIDAMQAFVLDVDLFKRLPFLVPLRHRAASALATLGTPRLVKWFATVLLKDEDGQVREQAARGMANASRRGDEGHLLDALGHADAWVRSWAADGLSRLGDARALPVLTGNLRHEHPPIREGAILSFVALGPEGFGGMLQGLEDPSRELQERVFSVILARDLAAFRKGLPPDVLTSALSSQRAEVRFAAARALELRTEPEGYLGHLVDILMPPKPEKAGDMKDWPNEETRERILVGLAEALAGDRPEQRYAAAQVLKLQRKPIDYFREASAAGALRSSDKPWVPDTTPRGPESTDVKAKAQRLRRLFMGDAQASATPRAGDAAVPAEEQARLQRLAFGAYVGLLRQVGAQDDETNRVRRDAIDRIVELCLGGSASKVSALPPLQRALDDGNHLVRRAAFAGLKRLYEAEDRDLPLTLALASGSVDVAKSALDELAARGETSKSRIAEALNSGLADVRRYAFELLEKLSPAGSLDPLLAALSSDHADLRLGVVERLAASNDARVIAALSKAMESDHEDLRLRAAELLAQRKDEHAIPVLAAFLRSEDESIRDRAKDALVALPVSASVQAIAARIEELSPLDTAGGTSAPTAAKPDEKASAEQEAAMEQAANLVRVLGRTLSTEALDAIAARFADDNEHIREMALAAGTEIAYRRPKDGKELEEEEQYDPALLMRFLPAAARSRHPETRRTAALNLRWGDDSANEILASLFTDRVVEVRQAAVEAYSGRVQKRNAPVGPLEEVLRAGARELMLDAAEGVASRHLVSALRPLLLFARAGEGEERPRALRALGTLGDVRALEELETIAAGGTEDAPAEPDMQAAAIEGLGRLWSRITDPEAKARVADRIEKASESSVHPIGESAVRALGFVGGERSRIRIEHILGDEHAQQASRVEAVKQLLKFADPASEKVLAKALDEWDSDIYETARKALEKIFPRDRARVELHCALSSQSDLSEPAIEWLAAEGDAAKIIPKLPEIEDEDLRKKLRWGLIRRGALPAPELAKALEEKNASIRVEVAAIIGTGVPARLKEGRPVPEADKTLLGNAIATAERRAAEAWAALRGSNADDAEEKRDAEANAWRMLLWAASELGARTVGPAAQKLVSGGDAAGPANLREEAAHVLGRIGSATDADALLRALGDPEARVRTASAAALARLSPDRVPVLASAGRPVDLLAFGLTIERAGDRRGFLTSPDGWRFSLPILLAKKDVAQIATVARTATDAAMRLDAIAALGNVGGSEAESVLQEIRKSGTDEGVRKAAFRALRRSQRSADRQRAWKA